MEKIQKTIPKNPYRYVKATHHYYASNSRRWKVDTDLTRLIADFENDFLDYVVWYVPLPKDAKYEIDVNGVYVENAHMIGAFYVNMEPNQF